MDLRLGSRDRSTREAVAAAGVVVVWLTVLAFSRGDTIDLTAALLVVLAEVLVLAVLTGPLLAVLLALVAAGLATWYLVPPYRTLEVANADNVLVLVVFALVAAAASALVELAGRARERADTADQQALLLGDVVSADEEAGVDAALDRVRRGLGLDRVELVETTGPGPEQVLAASGSPGTGPAVIAVELPDGYLLRGFGPEVFAPDPAFLVALGSAAVRSYERDLLADESRRAEELAAIDRARTALLASVGHDLRTPLTTVRIGLDSLRSPQAVLSDADRAELLDSIDAATSRLDDLITNLLDMSRLQAGTVIARVRPTVLADAVDQALLATPSDRVVVQLPDGLPPVLADAALLERIVANLVSNALRYSPSGSPVEVRARHDASTVVLEVADRGPGMPTADLTSAFTGLRHVGEHADGGSGLGLAIVRGFAEAMSMTAELRPRAGGGLVARVVIPRSAPEASR